MKIIFLCSCLEYGRDGVGDYTRRLIGALLEHGHQAAAVALADKYTETALIENQPLEDRSVLALRLPLAWPIEQRTAYAKRWIDDFNPEWISFQFVCFSFHPKGLVFNLHKHVGLLSKGRKLHIMLHELWVGEYAGSPFKYQILGWFQKQFIRRMMGKMELSATSTSNSLFQNFLSRIGIAAGRIIIFSNLPPGNKQGTELYAQLPDKILKNRKEYIIASFFGSIEYSDLESNIKKLMGLAEQANRKLLITHIGRMASAKAFFSEISKTARLDTHVFGECNDQDIADYFRHIDLGLSTYPKYIFEKSGSIAAMLNNGLPVLLLKKSVSPDNRKIDWLKEIDNISEISSFMAQDSTFCKSYGVPEAAEAYLQVFNSPLLN